MRIAARYAAEKTAAAYDSLASVAASAPERLTGAWHELSLLDRHQDQLSDRGRELYAEIKKQGERSQRTRSGFTGMRIGARVQLALHIRDLFYDTQPYYHGCD